MPYSEATSPKSEAAPRRSVEELNLQFPPLPQTLLEAVEMMHQPGGPDVARTVEIVERDPIVVTRLLSVVNSAYYSRGHRIGNVRRAVVALGPVSVTGIVMGMNMKEVETALNATTALPFLNLMRHSIATAFLARRLAEHDPVLSDSPALREFAATAYTAGLLHDFGKVVILYNFPDKAAALYANEAERVSLEAERAAFGLNHVEAGTYLARHLSVPDLLSSVLAIHHEEPPFTADDDKLHYLVTVTAAANRGAHMIGFSSTGRTDLEEDGTEPYWDALAAGLGYESGPAIIACMHDGREDLEGYVSTLF